MASEIIIYCEQFSLKFALCSKQLEAKSNAKRQETFRFIKFVASCKLLVVGRWLLAASLLFAGQILPSSGLQWRFIFPC